MLPLLLSLFAVPAAAAEPAEVLVYDYAEALTPQHEAMLRSETARIEFPTDIERVVYTSYVENTEDLTETFRLDFRHNNPELLNDDELNDGTLVLGVGLDPRTMAVDCSPDICEDLNITGPGRTTGILDQVAAPIENNMYEIGLLNGAKAAANPEIRRESAEGAQTWQIFVVASLFLLLIVGAIFFWMRTRLLHELVAKQAFLHARLPELQQLKDRGDYNIASLDGPLSPPEIKRDWVGIKTEVEHLTPEVRHISRLDIEARASQLYSLSSEVRTCHAAVMKLINAVENVEVLNRIERNDDYLCMRELNYFIDDVAEARTRVARSGGGIAKRLDSIIDRAQDLHSGLNDFSARFAALMREYHSVLATLPDSAYQRSRHSDAPPTLGDAHWHPGIGSHYMPFVYAWEWARKGGSHRDAFPVASDVDA